MKYAIFDNMALSKLKNMIPFICIVVGSLGAIIAGFVDYRNKLAEKEEQVKIERKRADDSQKLLQKTNEIIESNNNIITSQQSVIDTTSKIIALQNEINEKNNKIQELQDKTLNTIKGTSEPPIFTLANRLYKIIFVVTNESPELSASFSCTVYDYNLLKKCKIRDVNTIDVDCATKAVFFEGTNIKLKPKGSGTIPPHQPIDMIHGTVYKYLIYTDINENKYLEQVYINYSQTSINTLIRILKFDGKNYIVYSEPFKHNAALNWEKEFDLPTVLHLGKFVI